MIRVVTFLWRDEGYRFNHLFRYGADHVNRWASMVRRNLDMDHELVCVTDDSTGIDPSIRIVPLWDDLREMGGCYTRLRAFAPDMREIIGPRFVWMDLDCVVTGDLTPLFDRDEDFVAWRGLRGSAPYCGSMVMMTAGARKEVWETFDPVSSPKRGKALGYIGTDQAWISACLPGEATWGREDGVWNARRLTRGRGLPGRAKRLGLSMGLPENARVVFFTGPYDPSQSATQAAHPWIAEYWR